MGQHACFFFYPCGVLGLDLLWRFIAPLNKILAAQISFCPV
jgi:hypothetical protein